MSRLAPRLTRLVPAVAVAAGCLATGASPASAYLYFGGVGTKDQSIGRSLSSGKRVNQNFVKTGSQVRALAANSRYVYWVNGSGGIGRARANGKSVQKSLIPGANAQNIAINGTSIYWVTTQSGVGRANLDGSSANPNFIPGTSANASGAGIALDGTSVYWSVDTTADWGSGTYVNGFPTYVATVSRANLDGTSPNTSYITGTVGVSALAVNGSSIFAAITLEGGGGSQIGAMPLAGGAASQGFFPTTVANPTQVEGMDLSGGTIYYVDQNYQPAAGSIPPNRVYGSVKRVPVQGGKATTVVGRLSDDITAVAVG